MWQHTGNKRPPFAVPPAAGQESVWDYPRPPKLVDDQRLVRVLFDGTTIAETRRSKRLLETASPPTFYLPPSDVVWDFLRPSATGTFCEWKGRASYLDVVVGSGNAAMAAWYYASPGAPYEGLANFVSFYPGRVVCLVDGEQVRAQAGGFYGGWITPEIVGPFKGEGGTGGW